MTTKSKSSCGIAAVVALACGALLSGAPPSGSSANAQGGVSMPGGISRPPASQPGGSAFGPQSPWVKGHNSTSRLIAGALAAADGKRQVLAGVEIRLNEGWKTYWRHPGDDGGLPPTFDWSRSRNLKSAKVLYPMPERIKSLNGTTIGYAKAVVFPVEIEPVDPAQRVELALGLDYGICREICVPAEAKHVLTIEPGLAAMPVDLAAAMAKVPRALSGTAVAELLKSAKSELTGASPAITFAIATGPGNGAVDLFVEGPQSVELPVPAKLGQPSSGQQRFQIDLKRVENAAALKGERLLLTITGPGGASEIAWVVPK